MESGSSQKPKKIVAFSYVESDDSDSDADEVDAAGKRSNPTRPTRTAVSDSGYHGFTYGRGGTRSVRVETNNDLVSRSAGPYIGRPTSDRANTNAVWQHGGDKTSAASNIASASTATRVRDYDPFSDFSKAEKKSQKLREKAKTSNDAWTNERISLEGYDQENSYDRSRLEKPLSRRSASEEEHSDLKDGRADIASGIDVKIGVSKEQWQQKHEKCSKEDISALVPSAEAANTQIDAVIGASKMSGSVVSESAEKQPMLEARQRNDLESSIPTSLLHKICRVGSTSDETTESQGQVQDRQDCDGVALLQSTDDLSNSHAMVLWRPRPDSELDLAPPGLEWNQMRSHYIEIDQHGELPPSSREFSINDNDQKEVSSDDTKKSSSWISDEDYNNRMQSESRDGDDSSRDTESRHTTSRRSSVRSDPSLSTGMCGERTRYKKSRQPRKDQGSPRSAYNNRLGGSDSRSKLSGGRSGRSSSRASESSSTGNTEVHDNPFLLFPKTPRSNYPPAVVSTSAPYPYPPPPISAYSSNPYAYIPNRPLLPPHSAPNHALGPQDHFPNQVPNVSDRADTYPRYRPNGTLLSPYLAPHRYSEPPSAATPYPYSGPPYEYFAYNMGQHATGQRNPGYELVDHDGIRFIFKRPKRDRANISHSTGEREEPAHFDKHIATCVNIFASTRFSGLEDETTIHMIGDKIEVFKPRLTDDPMVHFVWLHMKHTSRGSFGDFERLMHAVGRQYRQYNKLIFDLLERFKGQRQNASPRSIHGELRPNLLRVHESRGADQGSEPLSATLLDYPVCDVVSQQSHARLGLPDLLRSSSSGNTTGAISQHFSRKQLATKSENVLVIPNMWAITLGSDVIVTYSHLSLSELCGKNIEISVPSDKPTTVRIEDLERNFHFFDLSTCKSFYTLQSLIFRECRAHVYSTDWLEILFEDGRRVTAENWLIFISRCQTPVITLVLALNDRSKGLHHTDSLPQARRFTNASLSTSVRPRSARSNAQHTTALSSTGQSTTIPSNTRTKDPPEVRGNGLFQATVRKKISAAQPSDEESKPEPMKFLFDEGCNMADLLGLTSKPFFSRTTSQYTLGLNHNLSQVQKDLRFRKLYRKGFERTLDELRASARDLPINGPSLALSSIPIGSGATTTSTFQKPSSPDIMIDEKAGPTNCTRQQRFLVQLFKATIVFYLHFLPVNVDHIVAMKYWGAVHTISTSLVKDSETAFQVNKSAFWTIRDPADQVSDVGSQHLPRPTTPFNACESCLKGTVFRSEEDAATHLRSKHFLTSELSNTYIHGWIVSGSIAKVQLWKMLQMDILERVVTTMSKACKIVQSINTGLSDDEEDEYKEIRPTKSLYNSFSQALQLLVFVGSTSRMINATAKKEVYEVERVTSFIDCKTESIQTAEQQMSYRESDLLSTLEAFEIEMEDAVDERVAAQYIPHATIGPDFLLLGILRSIADRPIHDGLGVTEFYEYMIGDLRNEVSQHPRKRLLQAIHQIIDEIDVVYRASLSQAIIFERLYLLLKHDTYANPINKRRAAMFNVELQSIQSSVAACDRRMDHLQAFTIRTKDLKEQLRQNLEILDSDQSNATYVFTTVTVIFLPLSFVTGFFGMNTADIRNSTSSQSLFWSIGLPLTILVIGLAYLIAYKGDDLRDWSARSIATIDNFQKKLQSKKDDLRDKAMIELESHTPLSWRERMPRRSKTSTSWLDAEGDDIV